MHKQLLPAGVIALVSVTLFLFNASGQVVEVGDGKGDLLVVSETDGENLREVYTPEDISSTAPTTLNSYITSNPYCFQPDPAEDVCYINIRYIYFNSDPTYMRYVTIKIDGKLVANYRGFFDTSISTHYGMNGSGFKVSCGEPGDNSEADPLFGKRYSYVIEGGDASDGKVSNSGSLLCPPFSP